MTPKDKVLKRWPDAVCAESKHSHGHTVYTVFVKGLGYIKGVSCDSENLAWADAARGFEDNPDAARRLQTDDSKEGKG